MLLFLTFCIVILGVQNTFLYRQVKAHQSFCIEDELPSGILVRVSMNNSGPLQLLIQKETTILLSKAGLKNETVLYTTKTAATHKICWANYEQASIRLGFEFAVGLKANDYHSTLDQDSHQQLLSLASLGVDLSNSISKTTNDFHLKLQHKINADTGLSKNSLLLTVVFIATTAILLLVQYRTVKRQIQKKKSM